MNDLSSDDLLTQATCAVLIEKKIVGTAWLVSRDGYLLTAGHVVSQVDPKSTVKVQFMDEHARPVKMIEGAFDKDLEIDYAVLKLIGPVKRHPLPILLPKEVEGQFRVCGYGTRLEEETQFSGHGKFSGQMYVRHSKQKHLFRLRGSDLGQEGNSGGAIFSNELKAVVGIQTRAAKTKIGPEYDIVLALPLYRIAEWWEQLQKLAENPPITTTSTNNGEKGPEEKKDTDIDPLLMLKLIVVVIIVGILFVLLSQTAAFSP